MSNAIVPHEVNEQQAIANYRLATNAAGICGEIVKRTAMNIQGRNDAYCRNVAERMRAHGRDAKAGANND